MNYKPPTGIWYELVAEYNNSDYFVVKKLHVSLFIDEYRL